MRTMRNLRAPGSVGLAAGALILAGPATALALTGGASARNAGSTTPSGVHVGSVRRHVAYDQRVVVRGSVPAADAGHRLALQFEVAGGHQWRQLSTTRAAHSGRFALRATMRRSGLLRVVDVSTPGIAADVHPGGAPGVASQPRRVQVEAGFRIGSPQRDEVAGRAIAVRGRLLPGTRGRRVRLITRSGRGWRTLASGRTSRRGRFTLHLRVPADGTHWLRVAFRGDRANRGTWAMAGDVTGMMYRVASWYNDGGSTACGFHAYYGVANKSLPCGTKVTFSYGGRSVTATVDDRGPYVAGRDYDLNQNTAAALGMYGVATVLASR